MRKEKRRGVEGRIRRREKSVEEKRSGRGREEVGEKTKRREYIRIKKKRREEEGRDEERGAEERSGEDRRA